MLLAHFADRLRLSPTLARTTSLRLRGFTAPQIHEHAGIPPSTVYRHSTLINRRLGTEGLGGWARATFRTVVLGLDDALRTDSQEGVLDAAIAVADGDDAAILAARAAEELDLVHFGGWAGYAGQQLKAARGLLYDWSRERIAIGLDVSVSSAKTYIGRVYWHLPAIRRGVRRGREPRIADLAQRFFTSFLERLRAPVGARRLERILRDLRQGDR